MKDSLTFKLGSFSGPLDFLIALVQNEEISLDEISLKEITQQYIQHLEANIDLDAGAEMVGSASFLIWYKSKQLLPSHNQPVESEEEQDPCFAIIHHLVDYCRFREAAKDLSEREQKQSAHYFRGITTLPEQKKTLGIEHLTLDDFASLFRQLISRSSSQRGIIQEEEWKISDKIEMIKQHLVNSNQIPFDTLFNDDSCREELIVIFLAVLEMMKNGILMIIKTTDTCQIMIAAKGRYDTGN